jgi:antitoxin component of MazEF toxin-antitoxin module
MVDVTCRKWGSSLGVIIPKEIVERQHLTPGKTITLDIRTARKAGDFFGIKHIPNLKKALKDAQDEWT